MRYSEIATLPGTPAEAKNTAMDIIAVYQSLNKDRVPLKVILKSLHGQNFDIDRRLLIELIRDEPPIESISEDPNPESDSDPAELFVFLKKHASDNDDIGTERVDKQEKNKKKVEKMAKKAIDKKG